MPQRPAFLKPDEPTWQEDKADIDVISGTHFVYNSNLSLTLEQQREKLPIFKNKAHIVYLLEKYQTLVLVGETGCGKSTQIPQYLFEAGWCNDGRLIGISEPRRVAATSLASRVAEERDCYVGETVGYAVRLDDCSSPDTRIKYMTEGILIREMMADPLLRKYCIIMLDEVHERSLNTDIIMGLMKKIIKKQKNLKLIVASATVDAENLQKFFNFNTTRDNGKDTSVILSVEGRLYPVEVFYSREPVPDYVTELVTTVMKIHNSDCGRGDILGFLTGQEEVDRAVQLLSEHAAQASDKDSLKLFPLPMYGSLTNAEQMKVFRATPRGFRKVVVATNIAEAAVTIPGIVYVIDCGFAKVRWFDPESHTESLVVVPISKAAAEQRAGRAGRVRRGQVYRLYTEECFQGLATESVEEMRRAELSSAILQLKALGISNVLRFDFPSPPPARLLLAGIELLHALGAVGEEGMLTDPLGSQMAEFPLAPLFSKSLLVSHEFGVSEEMCTVAALLQVKSVFIVPGGGAAAQKARIAHRAFEAEEGDTATLLNAYTGWARKLESGGRDAARSFAQKYFLSHKSLLRTAAIRAPLVAALSRLGLPLTSSPGKVENLCKCIAAGFFSNAAYLHSSGVYKTIRGNKDLHIHPSSVLYTLKQPQWVVYCETLHTSQLYMRDITVVKPEWLHSLAPHFYHIAVNR